MVLELYFCEFISSSDNLWHQILKFVFEVFFEMIIHICQSVVFVI